MTIAWLLAAAVGLVLAATASARAVDHAVRAASGLAVPAFVIGFTVLAVGTDMPEIANSIVASVAGHGDVNVGDSIGSVAAQAALALGLVPLLAKPLRADRHDVLVLGTATIAALLLGVVLMADGRLDRLDGVLLVGGWVVAIMVVRRRVRRPGQPELPLAERHPFAHAVQALAWLLVVGAGAALAVVGVTRAAAALAVPEYLVSFVGLALGTSLPELTVAVTAVRRGQGDLALGDVLGASLADASLSVGAGPLVAPTAVTSALAVTGGLATVGLVALATTVIAVRGRHTRGSGLLLVAAYLAVLPLIVTSA